MEGLYFEYLPTELITVLISKLDVYSLISFRDIYKNINWRDVYQLRYPYFIEGYNKIKKHDTGPFQYEGYHDILTLDEISDQVELRPLYDYIKYNLVKRVIFKFEFSIIEEILDTKDVVTFSYFWDVVQVLSEIYVGRLYPTMYDKFNKYDFDIHKSMNNTLYNILNYDDDMTPMVPSIKQYILTGKWNTDYVITLSSLPGFEELYDSGEKKVYYIIAVIMVCLFLEDNVKVESDVVTSFEHNIVHIDYSASHKIGDLLAPIYHPNETIFERTNFRLDDSDDY